MNSFDHEIALTCPIFEDPEAYLRLRAGRFLSGFLKRKAEERALDVCLRGLDAVRTVCDAPCGPARLFPYWRGRGFRVFGVDLSTPMVEAAAREHRRLDLKGSVRRGDAFLLSDVMRETPDLVASVRFAYYFERIRRAGLLRSLAAVSRRYVLVQYKTTETLKGQIMEMRTRMKPRRPIKYFCSFQQTAEEVREAGLTCLRIVPIREFSDRVFVLAEKPHEANRDRPYTVHFSGAGFGRGILRRVWKAIATKGG